MSFSNHMTIVTKNNQSMRNHASYFKYRGKKIQTDKRTGTSSKRFGVNKNAYQLTQERKAIMFRKGIRIVIAIGISFMLLAYSVVYLLS